MADAKKVKSRSSRKTAAPLPRRATTGNAASDALTAGVLDAAALIVFNGTTWDRLRGDVASGVRTAEFKASPAKLVSGLVTAPAAAAVIADTGVMAAGTYEVEIHGGSTAAAGVLKYMVAEHRNAANDATLQTIALWNAPSNSGYGVRKLDIALDQRIRVINGAAAGEADSRYQAFITAKLVP